MITLKFMILTQTTFLVYLNNLNCPKCRADYEKVLVNERGETLTCKRLT